MTSRLPGFHKRTPAERAAHVAAAAGLTADETALLATALSVERADAMVENAVGTFSLPLAIATNFRVNGEDILVPMAVEEASVVAAASHAARMTRSHDGFRATASGNVMIAQIHVANVVRPAEASRALASREKEILRLADAAGGSIVARGGGARGIECRTAETPRGTFLVVHLKVDVVDAMGANLVNTMAEAVADEVAKTVGGRPLMRILSNLATERLARAEAVFDVEELGGGSVVERILDAAAIADADPWRAATHNKGIMNGVDPVVIATGNDWRAVEAGAHAFAARNGRYGSLTFFSRTPDGHLGGVLEMPLALGTVGGATKTNPQAQIALKILGNPNATKLAGLVACVGLAQNVAALRALVSEGIQEGHMRLHRRSR